MPVRVLHIAPPMNFGGGIENSIMNYYRHVERDIVQFDFLVHTSEEGDFDSEIEAMGGHIFRATHYHISIFKNFIETYKILREHREIKIIHIHVSSGIKFLDGVAGRLAGKKVIFHSHSAYPTKKVLHRVLTPLFYLTGHRLFACSEVAGKYFFGKRVVGKKRFTVIRNAVDLSQFRFSELAREQIRLGCVLEDKFVIGHVGRFTEEKNHFFLIRVFEEALKEDPRLALLLVGEGPLMESSKKMVSDLGISDNVVFSGKRTDISRLLSAMDVFVMPSDYEGLGMALVEAQASGLRCIASKGVSDEVNVTGNVAFLSVDDFRNWVTCILSIKAEGVELSERYEIGELILSTYEIDLEAKKLQDSYRTIAGNR